MPIQIVRNESGNCLEFRGTSNPVYWNACVHGEVDAGDNTLVNVVNDVASAGAGQTVYEFFQIPYTEFRDQDNNPFADAASAAAYVTAQGNVTDAQNASYIGVWDADTNTPDISASSPSVGDFYFVSVPGSTLLDGTSVWRLNDRVIYNGTTWDKVAATQLIDSTSHQTLLSTNTAIPADGESAVADPTNQTSGWYFRNDAGKKINWYFYGGSAALNELGDFGGFYAVVDFRNATSQPYWQVYTAMEADGQDQGFFYRSRITYDDPSALSTALGATTGTYLVHSAGLDVSAIEPSLPRISLDIEPSTTLGPQAADETLLLMTLSTSTGLAEGTNEFVVNKVGYKIGTNLQEFHLASPPTTGPSVTDTTPSSLDFRVDPTDTTILVDDGKQYGVNSIHAIANGDGTIDITALPSGQVIYDDISFGSVTIQGGPNYTTENGAVNALNALFQVQPVGTGGDYNPTYPVLAGADITANVNRTITPTTTKSDGTTVHLYGQEGSSDDDMIWSTETIDTAGEYFTVKIAGGGRFLIGLGREEDGDRTEIESGDLPTSGGLIWGQAFYDYGSYTAPWTYYGSSASPSSIQQGWSSSDTTVMMRYNTDVQDELNGTGAPGLRDGALFKIGITNDGFIACWYYDSGRSNDWIMTSRRSLTTEAGNYFLVVKLWDGSNVMVELPQRTAVDDAAPILNYRYIESPDGSFDYPLFATAEEAEHVDGLNASETRAYPDDPTLSTWYVPANDRTLGGASAPVDTAEIIYNEIPTLADDAFGPAPFDIADLTVDEGAGVNYQINPQDVTSYTTEVTGLPAGLSFDGGYLIHGLAPAVADDNVVNPSDTYTITVTRSNAYSATVDTFDLIVNNLTAPQVTISGFHHQAGSTDFVDSDTLGDGSVAEFNNHLEDGKRLVIPRSWVDTYVLPAVANGATVRMGVATSSVNWGTIADSDFEAFISWGPQSATSHQNRLVTPTQSDSFGIGSLTNAVYDFAFEHDGTDLHLIACNVNAINTEPAVNDGGSFTRVKTWSNHGHTGTSFRIVIAVDGATMDIDETLLSELDIPTPPAPTITTPWTKALDFSGGAERTLQVTNDSNRVPLRMSGVNNNAAAPAVAGNTSNDSNARPWATSIVFKAHTYNDNQHVWNMGEGSGDTDDNIYLRRDANRNLWFGWGRTGSELNECYVGYIGGNINGWWGVYIASNGTRLGGGHSAADIAAAFDIRMVNLQTGATGSNLSTEANWTSGSFGARMNRQFTGDMTIGGRGANRSFRGKVASMVVTTLRRNVAMPTDAEISMMVRDPQQWMTDYKVGNAFRLPWQGTDAGFNWAKNDGSSSYATQVWLMGDGANDAYAQIRNNVWPATQNYTPMNMISMVSGDIENVNITGLS